MDAGGWEVRRVVCPKGGKVELLVGRESREWSGTAARRPVANGGARVEHSSVEALGGALKVGLNEPPYACAGALIRVTDIW